MTPVMQHTKGTDIQALLRVEHVRVAMPGTDKEAVLTSTLDLLRGNPAVRDFERMKQAVFEREQVMSTGVGKGLALPHAKTTAVAHTLAAVALLEQPVDFGAIDNEPVRIIFLLVGTEEEKSQHIKLLSRVSRLMNRDQFRDRLLKSNDSEEVIRIFEEGEARLLDE